MNELTPEEIAEAKRGHTAIVYKDGRPPDVFESDFAIAEAQLAKKARLDREKIKTVLKPLEIFKVDIDIYTDKLLALIEGE